MKTLTPVLIPDWLNHCSGKREDLRRFCAQHGIEQSVSTALTIAKKHFLSAETFQVAVERDDEADGEYLVIRVGTRGEVKDFLRDYNQCINEWNSAFEPQHLDLMSLAYFFV
jgi:hypothetical protein